MFEICQMPGPMTNSAAEGKCQKLSPHGGLQHGLWPFCAHTSAWTVSTGSCHGVARWGCEPTHISLFERHALFLQALGNENTRRRLFRTFNGILRNKKVGMPCICRSQLHMSQCDITAHACLPSASVTQLCVMFWRFCCLGPSCTRTTGASGSTCSCFNTRTDIAAAVAARGMLSGGAERFGGQAHAQVSAVCSR